MENIKKLETYQSDIYGERYDIGHYSDLDPIVLKVNEIIDRLNEQPEEETLVESVERKYNIDLGVNKESKLEELLKQKGLPAMSETLKDTSEEWEVHLNQLKLRLNGLPKQVEKEIERVKTEVKQLLEEREREVLERNLEGCEGLHAGSGVRSSVLDCDVVGYGFGVRDVIANLQRELDKLKDK